MTANEILKNAIRQQNYQGPGDLETRIDRLAERRHHRHHQTLMKH
jgi:hypothetical protein